MSIFTARNVRESQAAEVQALAAAEREARELPGTTAARRAAEAAWAARHPDAVRERYEQALAAQRARGEEVRSWLDFRAQVTRLAERAEEQRWHCFEAMDIEAALAANQRALGLRALLAPLDQHVRRKFPAGINLAQAQRI